MSWLSRVRRSGRKGSFGCALALTALAIAAFPAMPPTQAQATAVNLFLHGSGATANPAILFLDAAPPVDGTASYKDSSGVNFNGGNAWKEVGNWGVTPASIAQGDLTALGAVRIWIGLKNSDDQGTWFDVRAEVLKNGSAITSGLLRCIQGVTRNANQAKEISVAFDAFAPVSFDGSSDSLVLKVSTRIGTYADGTKCGGHNNAVGLRSYFDAVNRPSGFSATFLPNLGPLVIDSVAPVSGTVGTEVTILGKGFDPDAAGTVVTFGTTAAVVRSATATRIETTVPAGASAGSAQVSVTTRGGTATSTFTVGNVVPVIDYITPDSVSAGGGATAISVFGSGFIATSLVSIGDAVLVPTVQTSTRLEVEVPASLLAALGTKEVTVTNPAPGGGASNVVSLTVLGVSISGVEPNRAPVGSAVIISGIGFDPDAANNQVSFNGAPTVVVSATETAIETTVPSGGTTGPVSVTSPLGTASAFFTVTSGATLQISASPAQTVYSQGQPITITAQLVDADGQNAPDATVELVSDPLADSRVGDTFVYQTDGTYTITARVDLDGEPVTASVQVRVEGRGPTISCSQPIDGGVLNGTPGSTITLIGSVNNVVSETTLTMNGAPVALGADGGFSTPIATTWGVNFANLALVDGEGRSARRTCTFLLSSSWAPENQLFANALSFKITQPGVDDNDRGGPVDSLADPLATALNSVGLLDTLDNALRAANPLKPSGCDSQTCTIFGCICWYSSAVEYRSLQAGERTTSLTLVNGGVRSQARVSPVVIRLRVFGKVGPIPFDTVGFVTFEYVDVSATYDLAVAAGRPSVTIRPGTVTSAVGSISTSFSGLDGWIVNNVVVPLANSTLRSSVRSQIQSSITNGSNTVLNSILSGLDVTTLAPFAVPRVDGAAPQTVSFGVGLSSLNTTTARVLAGIGTRFQTTAAHSRPSLGAPLPPGSALLDPLLSNPHSLGTGVHVGVFNQALHALWRGGYFDVDLSEGGLNGLIPAGVALRTTAGLPPVAAIRSDGRVELSLGALQVHVDHPTLLAAPLDAGVGGRVSCTRQLVGDDVVLGDCEVDELHLSTGAVLDPATGAQLEELLSGVVTAITSRAANEGLPALPIPGFRIPASLAQYDLPAGGVLGIVNSSLSTEGNRFFVLRGQFGIR